MFQGGLDHWIQSEKPALDTDGNKTETLYSKRQRNGTFQKSQVSLDLQQGLTSCQSKALQHLVQRENVFLSGQAGTGKTHLIKRFGEWCQLNGRNLAITATTGAAAYLIGGKTIFSWASIGLGDEPIPQLVEKITRSRKAKNRWQETDVLIIDEVSMMKPELLEKLETLARLIRHRSSIFGGMQVVLVGDFYQLPPVYRNEEKVKFCFESSCWHRLIDSSIVLETIVRQTDPRLQKCLTEARKGELSSEGRELLASRVNQNISKQGIRPSLLFPYRNTVDQINHKKMSRLCQKKDSGDIHRYRSVIQLTRRNLPFTNDQVLQQAIEQAKNLPVHNPTVLCKGCQVMLLINLDCEKGLVNGSRGVVTEFSDDEKHYPVVEFLSGEKITIEPYEWKIKMDFGVEASVKQLPLALAWAVTIHKAQGASVDLAEIDVGNNIFEYGQAYVALSRVRSIEGLRLLRFDPSSIRANPRVKQFYQSLDLSDT